MLVRSNKPWDKIKSISVTPHFTGVELNNLMNTGLSESDGYLVFIQDVYQTEYTTVIVISRS